MNASELRRAVVEWAKENRQAPLPLLEAARALVFEMQEAGVDIAPAPEPEQLPLPNGSVAQVGLNPAPVKLGTEGGRFVPRDEKAAPMARTFNHILDVLAQKPLGSKAAELLELAAHLELVELQNEELRAINAELRAAMGGQ